MESILYLPFIFYFCVAFKGGARSRTEDKFLFEFGDKTIYPSPPKESVGFEPTDRT